MDKATCEEIYDGDGFECVDQEADNSWRHGCYMSEVYKRESDNTYWLACYRLSTDGEVNELGDGDAAITRVYPREVTTVVYTADDMERGDVD